jgi:radical SAM superfamily enzyme YgiQ (UPF0313 family)
MRIALIRPKPAFVDHVLWSGRFNRFYWLWVQRYPPLGLLQIAAFLERAGHDVRVIDAEVGWMDVQQAARALRAFAPEAVVGSVNYFNPRADSAFLNSVADRLRVRHRIVRGHFGREYPAEAAKLPGVACALTGKGFATLPRVLDALRDGGGLGGVPGVAFAQNGDAVQTPPEPPVPMDEWPFAARHLVDSGNYSCLISQRHPWTTALGSIGCPMGCVYCEDAAVPYQAMSPARIADELEHCARRHGIREVSFLDPMFNISRARTAAVAEEILRRDLRLSWSCMARADVLDENLARLMARAGCTRMHIGIESGDDETLKRLRRGMGVDDIHRGFAAARSAGIFVLGYLQVGHGDDENAWKSAIDLAASLDLDFLSAVVTVPLPGCALFKRMVREGRPDPWLKLHRGEPVAPDDWLAPGAGASRLELERRLGRMLRAFFLRPGYIAGMAASPRGWRVARTVARIAHMNAGSLLVRTLAPALAARSGRGGQ